MIFEDCGREVGMRVKTQEDVTKAVLEVMNRTRDPRLREIMVSLVTHLHAFVREVRLTEPEFRGRDGHPQ